MKKLLLSAIVVLGLMGCADPHNSNYVPTAGTQQVGPLNQAKFYCSQLASGQAHVITQNNVLALSAAGNPYAGLATLGETGQYNKTYRRCMEGMGYTEVN